jgi:hypothetical protein
MITKQNAKNWLPLVQALAEGRNIQYGWTRRDGSVTWHDIDEMESSPSEYRIKPEPKLRPWKPEEAPRAIIVKPKGDIGTANTKAACLCLPSMSSFVLINADNHDCHKFMNLDDLARGYVRIHEDGTESPCGVMEDAP